MCIEVSEQSRTLVGVCRQHVVGQHDQAAAQHEAHAAFKLIALSHTSDQTHDVIHLLVGHQLAQGGVCLLHGCQLGHPVLGGHAGLSREIAIALHAPHNRLYALLSLEGASPS